MARNDRKERRKGEKNAVLPCHLDANCRSVAGPVCCYCYCTHGPKAGEKNSASASCPCFVVQWPLLREPTPLSPSGRPRWSSNERAINIIPRIEESSQSTPLPSRFRYTIRTPPELGLLDLEPTALLVFGMRSPSKEGMLSTHPSFRIHTQ